MFKVCAVTWWTCIRNHYFNTVSQKVLCIAVAITYRLPCTFITSTYYKVVRIALCHRLGHCIQVRFGLCGVFTITCILASTMQWLYFGLICWITYISCLGARGHFKNSTPSNHKHTHEIQIMEGEPAFRMVRFMRVSICVQRWIS